MRSSAQCHPPRHDHEWRAPPALPCTTAERRQSGAVAAHATCRSMVAGFWLCVLLTLQRLVAVDALLDIGVLHRQAVRHPARTAGPACCDGRCPVCRERSSQPFLRVSDKDYWRCGVCATTYLDASHYLTAEEEGARYALHENNPDDPGYRKFLSKLVDPLLDRLPPGSVGLDFGCGPLFGDCDAPAVAAMLREAGHSVSLFDPNFAPDRTALARTYDFITATEVVEHLHCPADEFDRLDGLLRPGGLLAVMTGFQTNDAEFGKWHYRRDPTHVVFFREETFRLVAERRGWTCEFPAKDVALMRKPVETGATVSVETGATMFVT